MAAHTGKNRRGLRDTGIDETTNTWGIWRVPHVDRYTPKNWRVALVARLSPFGLPDDLLTTHNGIPRFLAVK